MGVDSVNNIPSWPRAVQLDGISRLCHCALLGGGMYHLLTHCLPVYSQSWGVMCLSWCFLGGNCHFRTLSHCQA